MLKWLALTILAFAHNDEGNGWSIDYAVWEEGPRTTVVGTARLYFTEDRTTATLDYVIRLPKGRLAGPRIGSDPGEPMIGPDYWHNGNKLELYWSETVVDQQVLPCEIPSHFVFYVIQTQFDETDLSELLADWGVDDSVWDLNLDGKVNGKDLAIVIGGWKFNEGTS